MARQFLIIDGYNLMHAAGIARRSYGPGDLERCRNRLIRWLVDNIDDTQKADTQIVFDAANGPSDIERVQTVHGMKIIYAPRNSDADTEIEFMLAKHSSPKQVIMVSSDHRLHKAANRRKAKPIDSEDFLAEFDEPLDAPPVQTQQRRQTKETKQPSSAEWEKIFGDIPELRDLQKERTDYPGELPDIADLE